MSWTSRPDEMTWLGFFKECIVSLIFLGISLFSLSTTFFLFQLKLWRASQQCFTIAISNRSFVLICRWFYKPFRFNEVDCFAVTIVSFINDIVLSFVATRSFGLQSSLRKVLSLLKVDLILWDLNIPRSFSLVPSTYGKFILILISSS